MFIFKVLAVLLVIQVAKASLSVASEGQFPFFSVIAKSQSSPGLPLLQDSCTAVLIGADYLLATASCLKKLLSHQPGLKALIGNHTNNVRDQIYHGISIDNITTHEKFVENDTNYDVGLVKLERKVHLNDYIKLVKLPEADSGVNEGTNLMEMACVHEKNNLEFQYFTVHVIDVKSCMEQLQSKTEYKVLHKSQFCVESVIEEHSILISWQDVLVEKKGSDYELIGFTTENEVAVTRISEYVDWIQKKMSSGAFGLKCANLGLIFMIVGVLYFLQ